MLPQRDKITENVSSELNNYLNEIESNVCQLEKLFQKEKELVDVLMIELTTNQPSINQTQVYLTETRQMIEELIKKTEAAVISKIKY